MTIVMKDKQEKVTTEDGFLARSGTFVIPSQNAENYPQLEGEEADVTIRRYITATPKKGQIVCSYWARLDYRHVPKHGARWTTKRYVSHKEANAKRGKEGKELAD